MPKLVGRGEALTLGTFSAVYSNYPAYFHVFPSKAGHAFVKDGIERGYKMDIYEVGLDHVLDRDGSLERMGVVILSQNFFRLTLCVIAAFKGFALVVAG